ncbi:vacuolar protein sorting-associated protein 13A [Eurytemora carolleeae]|uniref:vacuolar protein sorting-associated protein 13A n=1 Tax=Eurytemora carolleeae TaxID=1294199 RepID=UPI000C759E66|nr:vacuolar protein sorting-associated protein 13A [Eurytemora carolleeae]|eukprot:XP_023343767.1 vacuolar protein sorting-associated protein 13A-like [Eurytemora affinis]
MFNAWLANILNSYLGEVVEELDSQNLGVGALQGDILLIDLKLRSDCLSLLELPIEVIAGTIGKISFKIPWSNLSSNPVLVHVQDVNLVAVPISHRGYNEEKDSRLDATRKRRFLQKVESISVIKRAAKSQNSKEEKLKRELWETMIATFMNNVQVFIDRVHIRYEDNISIPGRFISCGICLESLAAETTNSKWKSCEINGNSKSIFKLVRFEKFCCYWNPSESSGVIAAKSGSSWRVKMREIMEKHFSSQPQDQAVLSPLSGKVKIMMNRSIADGAPRLLFDYQLKEIKVCLSKDQYHTMMQIQAALKFLQLSRIYRKYRPRQSIFSKPRHWWNYAYRCIKQQFIEPYYWSNIKKHREKYRVLFGLWLKRHQVGKSSSLKAKIKEAETDLDVTSIMLAREQAKYQV